MRRGTAWADEGSSLGPDRHARDVDSLDRYAMDRWEVILQFMVGSPSAAVSQDLAQLLTQAGLMRRYMHARAVVLECILVSRFVLRPTFHRAPLNWCSSVLSYIQQATYNEFDPLNYLFYFRKS